ncbi:MAG: GDSL-type esterase/lipase family protein [Methylacidiphilales bacterium]|nr:GDSL-type esterase/lipase family protein [Candidatus Methylacidiphilales bacterium]
MKINSATLLPVLIFCLVSAWAWAGTPIDPNKYSVPVRVACVGDSITQGVGADDGKSYPSQLQTLLGDKWVVKNFGVSGRTLLRKGDAPYWREQAYKDAIVFKPDVVIIMLGTNDTKPQNWVHHVEFYSDYKDLVESFQDLSSKPRIFLCRPCPVLGQGNYGINETNLMIEIPIINRLASEEGVGIIDMYAALAGKPQLLPDRVHPNTEGAALMAQAAAKALKRE